MGHNLPCRRRAMVERQRPFVPVPAIEEAEIFNEPPTKETKKFLCKKCGESFDTMKKFTAHNWTHRRQEKK